MRTRGKFLAGLVMLLAGFVLLVGGLLIELQPNEFQAVVRIAIDYTPDPNSYDPYFILTEFEIIQSRAVLGKVIASQNLATKWSEKYNGGQRLSDAELEQMLKRKLDIRPARKNGILDLRVFDGDPAEAAALANGIARSYRELKTEQYEKIRAAGIDSLKEQLKEQEAKVKTLQEKLEEQKRELNISDGAAISNQPAAAPYLATKVELETARKLGDTIKQTWNREVDSDPGPVQFATIINPATVPSQPIRPNRPMGIAMLIAGLALIIVGTVFLRNPSSEIR